MKNFDNRYFIQNFCTKDPEVTAAFQEVSTNPANFIKYQNNPKVKAVLEKIMKFSGSGMGGFPGFGAGMGGGFPGGFPPSGGAPPASATDDDGLD